jgi:hypothetical protein
MSIKNLGDIKRIPITLPALDLKAGATENYTNVVT